MNIYYSIRYGVFIGYSIGFTVITARKIIDFTINVTLT
jgi:hypothetical protein